MKVLWTKDQKIPKEIKESSVPNPSVAHACGDSYGLHCSVCSRACSLRRLRDSTLHDGSQISYEQLVCDCFGIKISCPESVICSSCVKQLRFVFKFKKQIIAAFENTIQNASECPPNPEPRPQNDPQSDTDKDFKFDPIPVDVKLENYTNQELLALINKKLYPRSKKEKKVSSNSFNFKAEKTIMMKTIVNCTSCGHKYPMLYWSDTIPQAYICARCKLKRNPVEKVSSLRKHNNFVPTRQTKENLDGKKLDSRLRLRVRSTNSTQAKSIPGQESQTRPVFQRGQYNNPLDKTRSINSTQVQPIVNAAVTRLPQKGQKKNPLDTYRDALEGLCKTGGRNLTTKMLVEMCKNADKSDAYESEGGDNVFKPKHGVRRHQNADKSDAYESEGGDNVFKPKHGVRRHQNADKSDAYESEGGDNVFKPKHRIRRHQKNADKSDAYESEGGDNVFKPKHRIRRHQKNADKSDAYESEGCDNVLKHGIWRHENADKGDAYESEREATELRNELGFVNVLKSKPGLKWQEYTPKAYKSNNLRIH